MSAELNTLISKFGEPAAQAIIHSVIIEGYITLLFSLGILLTSPFLGYVAIRQHNRKSDFAIITATVAVVLPLFAIIGLCFSILMLAEPTGFAIREALK